MLILSLFPGIGLLDMAFEEEGFCVVRGPDVLWGGDIRLFHPPSGKFNGIIGGPPCQAHSSLGPLVKARWGKLPEDLIPEFVRCVEEARPEWFLMENVRRAPIPYPESYKVQSTLLNNRNFGAAQNRIRRFTFGTRNGKANLLTGLEVEIFENPEWQPAMMATGVFGPNIRQRTSLRVRKGPSWATVADSLKAQGLPKDYLNKDITPLTARGAQKMIGNGVPLPMGRAVAKAIKIIMK